MRMLTLSVPVANRLSSERSQRLSVVTVLVSVVWNGSGKGLAVWFSI